MVYIMLSTAPDKETLLATNQMKWYGLSVNTTPNMFGGNQIIQGDKFDIPLFFGEKRCFFHFSPVKKSDSKQTGYTSLHVNVVTQSLLWIILVRSLKSIKAMRLKIIWPLV